MKSHLIMSRGAALLLAVVLFTSCESASRQEAKRSMAFNDDWVFYMGDPVDAFEPSFEDADWIPVHLPHDWSIMDYAVQDSLHDGPFFKHQPGGKDVGYLRDGIAWYRKSFLTPEGGRESRYFLSFDGVQTQMELWVNGSRIGEHVYGYTPFEMDITAAMNEAGEENVIAIKTVNNGENSRWFAGAGIYRPVHLVKLNPVAVPPHGVYITTPKVNKEQAEVFIRVEIENHFEREVELNCEIRIHGPEVWTYDFPLSEEVLDPDSKISLEVEGVIPDPRLWSPDTPSLYRAEIILYVDGALADRLHQNFGIRSIEYSANDGLLLNGEEILLKGACLHHDNGLLGAAAFRDAEYRKVKIMKSNGYNAIRTSHNPPSTSFLEACDELGMLVIDEAFDHWIKAKRPNDYSNYFKEWSKIDIQSMVKRDKNHASVFMWSFGNEIQERGDPEGVEIGRTLGDYIREVDATRPVTQAVCSFWDNPGKVWEDTEGAFGIQDIAGYNYQLQQYEPDHEKFPDRLMYGSESIPMEAWENWELVKRHTYVLGDFVWTGMDYIGESGLAHTRYDDTDNSDWKADRPWPWYNAWCGDIDLLGNKKPQSFYRDVIWGESSLELMVSPPVPEGKFARVSYWGWPNELPHWNWQGYEGEVMKVRVFSSAPEVSLELNGKELERVRLDSLDKNIAVFKVPFSAGKLEAKAWNDDGEMESKSLGTTGEMEGIYLEAERESIKAGKNSLAYIQVSARDASGVLVPTNASELELKVEGPLSLMAAGNANPRLQGSFTDEKFQLFRGRGLIILRSSGVPGKGSVEISTQDGKRSVLEIGVK